MYIEHASRLLLRWPNDDDWPTWDPHHPVTPEMKRCGDVIRDFFREKTVIFVGDSINLLVHNAFMCDAARDGFMPMVGKDPRSLPRLLDPQPPLWPRCLCRAASSQFDIRSR